MSCYCCGRDLRGARAYLLRLFARPVWCSDECRERCELGQCQINLSAANKHFSEERKRARWHELAARRTR